MRKKVPDPVMSFWMVLTFLGGVLNYSVLRWMVTMLPEIGALDYSAFWVALASLLLTAIFIPVVYSAVASHALPQKTLVRPLEMSIVTAGLLFYQENPFLMPVSTSVLILSSALGIIVLGMISEVGAVSLVGYGRRPLHQRTLKVPVPIQDLYNKFSEEGVKRAFLLDKHRSLYDDKLTIFRNDSSEYAFFVVLAQSDASTTYVHMEGYDILRYVIEGTPESKRRFDRDADDIVELIRKEISPKVEETQDYVLKFPFKAKIEEITREPSVTKFSVIGRLPRSTIFILVSVVFLGFAAYLIYLNRGVTGLGFDFFVTTLIGLAVLLLGLMPFMKWSRKEKGWET